MSEWWTYRLSSFLMFSPRTYWRLVELYNRDVWPAHLITLAAGLLILWLAAAPRPAARRAVAAILATAWLWVGWAFHWRRYATIDLSGPWFAAAFWVQALLLVALALWRRGGGTSGNDGVRVFGWALAVAGVLLYPLAGLAAGRPWTQAEVFGVMPEPTALATLGVSMVGGVPHARLLSILPVLSLMAGMARLCVLSSA